MLRIDKDIDIKACENFIARAAVRCIDNQYLRLATRVKPSQVPGGAVAVAQAVLTWAQTQESPTLWTYAVHDRDLNTLKNMSRHVFGYAALSAASAVVSSDRTAIDAAALEALAETDTRFSSNNINDAARGLSVFIPVRDDYPSTFPTILYDKNKIVKNESAFYSLAGDLFERVLPNRKQHRAFLYMRVVAGLFRELFCNTQDHARKDIFGRTIKRSIRGIYIANHNLRPEQEVRIVGEVPAMRRYFDMLRKRHGKDRLEFLEFSVFDSGPGLVSRMSGKDLSLITAKEEYEILCGCFRKHASSKNYMNVGFGLYRTMGMVKTEGGYIQVRSGRLAQCKFFEPDGREPFLVEEDFVLEDVYKTEGFSVQGLAVGAAVTVLLPLK